MGSNPHRGNLFFASFWITSAADATLSNGFKSKIFFGGLMIYARFQQLSDKWFWYQIKEGNFLVFSDKLFIVYVLCFDSLSTSQIRANGKYTNAFLSTNFPFKVQIQVRLESKLKRLEINRHHLLVHKFSFQSLKIQVRLESKFKRLKVNRYDLLVHKFPFSRPQAHVNSINASSAEHTDKLAPFCGRVEGGQRETT